MAVVLLLTILQGSNVGLRDAAAKSVENSVGNLQQGLGYFYQDQNYFPTAVEFADQVKMSGYYDNFPPVDLISPVCSQSYVYKRINDNSYQLNFCLPASEGSFRQGWNSLNKN